MTIKLAIAKNIITSRFIPRAHLMLETLSIMLPVLTSIEYTIFPVPQI